MKINVKPQKFDEAFVFNELDNLKKQGYSAISGYPAWLMNEHRELSLEEAVRCVNRFLKARKLAHEELYICKTPKLSRVVTESAMQVMKDELEMLMSKLSKTQLEHVHIAFIKPE